MIFCLSRIRFITLRHAAGNINQIANDSTGHRTRAANYVGFAVERSTFVCSRLGKGKGSPYSITERRVLELIPVLCSQPAGDVSHKPGGRLPLLSARPAQLAPQPLRGLLPVLLLGEQRHDKCEQFA